MYKCPFCNSSNTKISLKDYFSYDLIYCYNCDVEFMHPYEAPGAAYYENSIDELSSIRHIKLEKWPSNHPSSKSSIFNFKNTKLEVLDIGCSNGAFAEFVSLKGHNILGMDFDANSLQLAKTRKLKNSEFIIGDLKELNRLYPNRKFDIVSMFMVLEHIENPINTINEIYNLLKPGAFFIGTIPNEKRYFAKTYNMKSALPPLHLNYWNKKSFQNHIEKYTNFKIHYLSNNAHYGYVAYVWKMKVLPKTKNPLLIFLIRVVYTIAVQVETLIEKINIKGSGTYFELLKD